MTMTLNINPNVEVNGLKLTKMFSALKASDTELPFEDFTAILSQCINTGLLSREKKDQRTPNERAEQAAVSKETRSAVYNWLRTHEPPMYDGSRDTAKSITEILSEIGIPQNRTTSAAVRAVLESESTGWGTVARIDGLRLYAKKAVLLAFRNAA